MESIVLGFLFCAFSTFRLAHMLCYEGGPCDCLEKLRTLPFLKDLFACFYCTSVWVAAPHSLLLVDADSPIKWLGHAFVISMALSTIAIFILEVKKRLQAV